jgi:hypothetical protein
MHLGAIEQYDIEHIWCHSNWCRMSYTVICGEKYAKFLFTNEYDRL